MRDIPVPVRAGETIEALTDVELVEVITASDDDDEIPLSWSKSLACEVVDLRTRIAALESDLAAAVDERDRLATQVECDRNEKACIYEMHAQAVTERDRLRAELAHLQDIADAVTDADIAALPVEVRDARLLYQFPPESP